MIKGFIEIGSGRRMARECRSIMNVIGGEIIYMSAFGLSLTDNSPKSIRRQRLIWCLGYILLIHRRPEDGPKSISTTKRPT